MNTTIMIIMAAAFNNITRDIGRIFSDPNYGIFGGADIALLGVFVFMIFFILTLVFGLGMLVGSVIIIPVLFVIFEWIPDLKIVVALIMGLMFGMALNKLVKR